MPLWIKLMVFAPFIALLVALLLFSLVGRSRGVRSDSDTDGRRGDIGRLGRDNGPSPGREREPSGADHATDEDDSAGHPPVSPPND